MTSMNRIAVDTFRCEKCNEESLNCICPRDQRLARLLDGPPISDEAMRVYRDEGSLDFYRLVACQMFGVAYSQATEEQCRMAREFYLAQVLQLAG
jgi:hypothetical protein